MERGLYIAASGMLAEQVRQDQLANDLANASTPGYKADNSEQASFSDLLLWNSSTGAPIGSLSMGSRITHVVTDLTQGPLQSTGNPLDVALDGPGFLAVATGSGVRYTRDGQLLVDARGRLCTDTGNLVLGTSGKPITVGQVSDPSKISIDQRGTVKVGTRTVGTLAVMSLTGATKQGDTLFAGTPGVRPGGTTVQQGFLEGSGVQPAEAMVDMIVSFRAYETTQRAIQSIDTELGRAANSVGSATGQ
jgi:flagellar basal-body rod protein FlgF